MSLLHKIRLGCGLKRLISGLVCLMMVAAVFPIHILNSAVCLAKEEKIDVFFDSPAAARSWLGGCFAKQQIAAADNINIVICDDFIIYSDDCLKNDCQKACFFDFTSSEFRGKTININGGGRKIIVKDKDLLFMDMKDCTVNLNDVVLDGANVARTESYIKVEEPSDGQKSRLNINANSSIVGCVSASGGAIYAFKNAEVNMNNCSKIGGCLDKDGEAMRVYDGTVNANSGVLGYCCAFGGHVNAFYGAANCLNGVSKANSRLETDKNPARNHSFRSIGMPRVEDDCHVDEIDDCDCDILDDVENILPNKFKNVFNVSGVNASLLEFQSDCAGNTSSIYNYIYPDMNEKVESEFGYGKAGDMHEYRLVFRVVGDASWLPEQVMLGHKGDEIYVPQYFGYHLDGLECGGLKIYVCDGKIVLDESIIDKADKNHEIVLTAHWNMNK